VFAQQIAALEMSDDLITKALQSHMLDRAYADQLALSGNNFLQMTGFDKHELTVVLVDDGPDPALITAMWGDIYSAKARDQHSYIIQLAGPLGQSLFKAICYVEVMLPAFRDEYIRTALGRMLSVANAGA
jgi:hypothetical protein